MESKHGYSGAGLTSQEMSRLEKLLRGDFHFVPSIKDHVDRIEQELCALTREQYSILESLEDNPRTLVSGMAGTGKTLLGMEQARRMSIAGCKVMYICFNRNIAEYIQDQFAKENQSVVVSTFHSAIIQDYALDCNKKIYL